MKYIHSNHLKKGSFTNAIYSRTKTSLKWIFIVSALNRKSDDLCSARLSERVKMRKSLEIH